jgi:hypothetical protein
VFCEADHTWRETREQFVGLVSRPAVAELSGWIMTQSWLDNKLNHILVTAESISTMSLLHSLNVFLSLLFALLDVGNNLIFFVHNPQPYILDNVLSYFPVTYLVLSLLFLQSNWSNSEALRRHLLSLLLNCL